MPDKKIILVGGGGHCRSCIEVIESDGSFTIAGIVERPGRTGSGTVLGYPVIGDDWDLKILKKECDHALVTIGQTGSSAPRRKIFVKLQDLGYILPAIISPLAHVSRHASIGAGTIVMHHALVNAGAGVGENSILNTKSLVEHDAKVGSHTHVSTGAVINGGASVGNGSFVGSGAVIAQGVKTSDNLFFKAGSLITAGNAGKPVRE